MIRSRLAWTRRRFWARRKIVDVALEKWAIFVATSVAGSFTSFSSGDSS
jgi:hypothetical protein